ncbi:MAG: anaerobic sulfatase maturase [Candidatus Brocadiia bacterium]
MPRERLQFQLLIKPSGSRCNLRCRYCFYLGTDSYFAAPGEGRGKQMSRATLERMVREFVSYRMPQSILAWQGGEPTLCGLDFFRAAVEAEQRHGADGQVVGNALQTNGVLLDDAWCEFLARYHFLVGLSLDGPRPVHEAMRGKCFDKVMRAAELMRKHGVEFNILCVVSQANASQGAEVYQWLVDQGFTELQFIPCREVGPDGKPLPFSVGAEELGDFLIAAFERWVARDVGYVSERVFNSLLAYFLHGEPDLCTFRSRCGDYICIERGGEVFPCDFYVQPEHKLGELGQRPMHEFYTVVRPQAFGKLKAQVDPGCRECEFYPMCHGGCPRDRLPHGRNAFCEGYRRFFKVAAPRLEGLARQLRLLGRR